MNLISVSFLERLLNAVGRKETGKEQGGVRVSLTTSVSWALASMPLTFSRNGMRCFLGLHLGPWCFSKVILL